MLLNTFRVYAAAGCLIGLASCGNKQQAQQQGPPPAVPVTVSQAAVTDAVYFDEYPGTVVALKQTELRAQVTGYVTGIHFNDGAKVTQGQKLYTIDQQLYEANYQQALANLAVQETNLAKAQKDAERYRELDKKDAIAKQQVDYAEAALEAAQKQLEAAKANVNAVKANVRFSTIYAPFTGTIGISQVRVGTSVVAGQTVLNTVSADNPIAVDFTIDQKELYRFSQLQQKGTKKGDSTFTIAFGNEVYPYAGTINTIDRAVDPQTGTIKVRLTFPNDKNLLRAGMTTTVRVLNTSSEKAITIPYKSVIEQLGTFFVYVVGDSNRVTQRQVVLGRQIGTDIIIREGLSQGETIVTQGVQNLREGAVINPQPAGEPAKQ